MPLLSRRLPHLLIACLLSSSIACGDPDGRAGLADASGADGPAVGADAASSDSLSCGEDELSCGGACSPCPDGEGIEELGCRADACAAVACAVGLHFCESGCCSGFVDEELDPAIYRPSPISIGLAVDGAGRPHIAYFDSALSVNALRYVTVGPGGWTHEVIDGSGKVFRLASVAAGPSGELHVLYQDLSAGTSNHARRAQGAWTVDNIPAGLTAELRIDAAGQLQTAFSRGGDIGHARRTGAGWESETVAPGSSVSMAIDGQGGAHLSFYRSQARDLHYARQTGSDWAVETVESADDAGALSSIAVDTEGRPHVLYVKRHQIGTDWNQLKYATRGPDGWQTELLPFHQGVGTARIVLVLDSQDRPHVLYYHGGERELRYARFTGAVWSVETVAIDLVPGAVFSLALGPHDDPQVAYADYTDFTKPRLHHARSGPPITR
jgi:hypothetical protein